VQDELGISRQDVVVGMVGRLVREKGFVEFFRAMSRIMERRGNVRSLVVGAPDPGQSDGITQEVAISELSSPRAIWLGRRSDLPELYSAMDIFALPSYREGIPRTVMEASAMELPVVTSNIRGCREVVTDGVTGFLVEPREVLALSRAIEHLVDSEAMRAQFGQAGRRHVTAQFDARVVLDRLTSYYRSVTGRRATS